MRQRCALCGRLARRSSAQNALYWALLTEISERLKVDGRSCPPPTWGEYFKRKFLGAEEFRLPTGETIVVPNSSSELDEPAFSSYISQIEEWSRDRGVWLPERPE